MPAPPAADTRFPELSWPAIDGSKIDPNAGEGWRLLIVYRGKHCPICTSYLNELEGMAEQFQNAGVSVMTVSADPVERAKGQAESEGWRFPIGCELTPDEMRQIGLYVSTPRSPDETDRPFAEPGTFAINPDGKLQIIDVSNAPFSRPPLKGLLQGLQYIQKNDYPVRGIG